MDIFWGIFWIFITSKSNKILDLFNTFWCFSYFDSKNIYYKNKLRKINTQHSLINVTSSIEDKVTLDSYHVKITGSTLFSKDKPGGGTRGKGTTNVLFDKITPAIAHSVPKGTVIDTRLRTSGATSVSGSEISFGDKGYEGISLVNETSFPDLKISLEI